MDIPIHKLDGARLGAWTLRAHVDRTAERLRPFTIDAESGGARGTVLAGRTNPGTSWRWPWMEARFRPFVERGGERQAIPGDVQEEIFRALGSALTPGSYVMLSLDGHAESARALTLGVPPACSPIGHFLWIAGCRWYKLWYYPEGWMEGNEKVQGNVPPNQAHRALAESDRRRELAAFLEEPLAQEFPGCAALARRILGSSDPNTGSRTG